MKLEDMIEYSIKYLRTQKLRSWLTITGIVIGIAVIVSLIAIADGVKYDVENQLSEFGSNYLIIAPVNIEGGSEAFVSFGRQPTSGKLYEKDYQKIRSIAGIDMTARIVYGRTSVEFKGDGITSAVYGMDAEGFYMLPGYLKIENGRLYSDNEKRVVVLGNDAANELFGRNKIRVNNKILLGGHEYRVVGVLEKIGTAFSETDDSAIYVPYDDGRELFKSTLLEKEISMIFATVSEGYDIEIIKGRIEDQLLALHKISRDDKDFSVITAEFVNKMIGDISNTLTAFLVIISSVAAFVGGIGISNTMFMSVLNRTREIGVLKSTGAKKSDILMLFIIEAILIGLVGGIIGIGIGIAVVEAVKSFGIIPIVSFQLIAATMLFSIGVGAVAGAVPAYNASKIPAIEALKY